MGVTEAGYKKVLGFTQASTENASPITELLRDLIERGLSFEEGDFLRRLRLKGAPEAHP